MNNKVLIKFSIVFIALFFILISPITAFALDEVPSNNDVQVEEPINNETLNEKDDTDETLTDEDPNSTTDILEEPEVEEPTTDNPTSIQNEVHKVSVVIKKVDDEGNYLPGATLQILNSDGEVVEEWISTEEDYETFLPEGEYTLHEVAAPEGYEIAEDQPFSIVVEKNELNANTEHDTNEEICPHYTGVALFYIESNGVKEEAYCVNQDWEEPHNVSYDGQVLTEDNIKSFLPDSDDTMTDKELYDKVLDIIYHRSMVEETEGSVSTDEGTYSNTEIRMITEYALKNYTSAKFKDGRWARYYSYSEESTKGYVIDEGNGTTLGKLAQHWYTRVSSGGHGKKIPKKYADLYYYLISEENPHPADMHLYLYSTQSTSEDEPYQNLLGVTWFNPYDDDYKVDLECVNTKIEVPEEPEEPVVPEEPVTPEEPEEPTEPETPEEQPVISYRIENPEAVQTSDNILLYLSLLIIGSINMTGCLVYSKVNNK